MYGIILGILPDLPHIPLPAWFDPLAGKAIMVLFFLAFIGVGYVMAYGLKHLWSEPAGEG